MFVKCYIFPSTNIRRIFYERLLNIRENTFCGCSSNVRFFCIWYLDVLRMFRDCCARPIFGKCRPRPYRATKHL